MQGHIEKFTRIHANFSFVKFSHLTSQPFIMMFSIQRINNLSIFWCNVSLTYFNDWRITALVSWFIWGIWLQPDPSLGVSTIQWSYMSDCKSCRRKMIDLSRYIPFFTRLRKWVYWIKVLHKSWLTSQWFHTLTRNEDMKYPLWFKFRKKTLSSQQGCPFIYLSSLYVFIPPRLWSCVMTILPQMMYEYDRVSHPSRIIWDE